MSKSKSKIIEYCRAQKRLVGKGSRRRKRSCGRLRFRHVAGCAGIRACLLQSYLRHENVDQLPCACFAGAPES